MLVCFFIIVLDVILLIVAAKRKMAWFRKKGKYWYFVEKCFSTEIQHYIGDDEAVKTKLILFKGLPPCKNLKGCEVDKLYCPFRNPKVNAATICQYYELDIKLLPNGISSAINGPKQNKKVPRQ